MPSETDDPATAKLRDEIPSGPEALLGLRLLRSLLSLLMAPPLWHTRRYYDMGENNFFPKYKLPRIMKKTLKKSPYSSQS